MICRSVIRRFDGDDGPSFHAAVLPRDASALRFVSWVTLTKSTGRYAGRNRAPGVTVAWIPAERIADETSSPAEIDAALANTDQIPLVVEAPRRLPVAYRSDDGAGFPTVTIKGQPMALVVRLGRIQPGTHGQLTFGWRIR
ncbi:hypothetical protein PPSIR1_21404 [Plesiocystis pacifica SIR-1]|uniref:Uncharacterized protein n=1 Tax=Plesiocystis pacifica SIR-1 TaxID=391625 RepID=A6G3M0_9BACT|nr:hypothetical protein [Plesiocystis pacifica]EDM79627.1 hypothetical protein PPSIR1_21404 [Plesiocystis pacifica SIR-1]